MVCPLCDGSSTRELQSFPPYTVVRCRRCGLVRLQPQPSAGELERLYDDPVYFQGCPAAVAGYREGYERLQSCLATSFQADLALLERLRRGGDLLEVGCGYGGFLLAARARGYRVSGIDRSAPAIEQARAALGPLVHRRTLPEHAGAHPASADLIYGAHVLEHVPDPLEFAAAAARILRPGGLLMCVTPNHASWLARLSGRRWVSYKIPEHLFFFTPATLTRLLARWFEVIHIDRSYPRYPFPVVMDRARRLLDPLARWIPRLERWPLLAHRSLRLPDGSMRVVARLRS